ncbi:bifunctional acetate--CoA ligase family protein/GNAT family N-acetyltransferase [Aquipuribacter sp. SD81]|uniref:bifunctional acetate--CoA ligase family protein/GNAT family N-acetyltransferase n=1 Tax=Aquipuribacter sp. SD81 TaxID=3127703 RepID=UPI003015C28B
MDEPDPTAAYPGHWEADVVLRDGSVAHVRPIRPDDAPRIERFHAAQSPRSIYFRFFAPMPRISAADLHRFVTVDHDRRVALVTTVRDEIVGIGRYDVVDERGPGGGRVAEVAFNISDAHQGRGIGSVLLEHLAAAARDNGVTRFEADVLPANQRMLAVFRDAGYQVSHHLDDGVISVGFDIDPTERSIAVRAAREHRAESLSMRSLLSPRSVVVVGASRDTSSFGARLLGAVIEGGFAGPVHVVNREALELGGTRAYNAVEEVPGPVDLAVVTVPAASVPEVVSQCADLGVRGAVIVSSGFAEAGPEGVARQHEVLRLARAAGIRLVGPNSFGIINTDPEVRLNASVAPRLPAAGGMALFSQSGALGVAVLASADRRGLGISSFLSAGNRADVSGNDAMQYWLDDPRTAVVGLYLESVGNPRKFSRIARQLARVKPTVVVKSWVSGYGVPPGHEVRRSDAPPAAFDAMLRQAGVIRTENLHQMFDVAQVALHQPLPGGDRVAVVGNSPALNALAADACASWGLPLAGEPVAVGSEADAEEFAAALQEVYARPDVDAVVASFIPPLQTGSEDVQLALQRTAHGSGRTTVACFVGPRLVGSPHDGLAAVPAYPLPEDAVRALAAVVRYSEWRRRDSGPLVDPPGVDRRAARRLVADVLADAPEGRDLAREEVVALLACYGVEVWRTVEVQDADGAAAAAAGLGYPVVLKAATLRHRLDTGGIRLSIADEAELRADVAEMQAELGARPDPGAAGDGPPVLLVQHMAGRGVSTVVTTAEDPLFGPIVSFGLAGDAIDLLGDVAHRIPPLTTGDVHDLVRGVRAAPRLFGHGGRPRVDVDALEDVVARVSLLAEDLPQVASLRLQPVHAGTDAVAVLDATARVAPPPTPRADGPRRALLAVP